MNEASTDVRVGCRAAGFTDPVQGARIPTLLLYPTRAPARSETFGPYALDVARDAPPEGEGLPLVVVSHGTGGSPFTLRGLAGHLARAGFVVALLEHTGNSRNDNDLVNTIANVENRPRHVRLAVDAALADLVVGARIAPDKVAVIGHSMGGYTALAVVGGRPTAFPHEVSTGASRTVKVSRDARVRGIVLLAPATGWFLQEGALDGVDVPILMRTGERDDITPAMHAAIVEGGVRDPSRLDHRVIPGAGHFAFQTPFPPPMVRADFPPSQDPPGFDRTAFQPVLHAEITAFLRRTLA